MKSKSDRKFGGILDRSEIRRVIMEKYPEADKGEILVRVNLEEAYQKRHLKAYLRGQERFAWGKDKYGMPIYFKVEDNKKPINEES